MTDSNTEDEMMVSGADVRGYAYIARLAQFVWSEQFGDARLAYTQHRARKRAAVDLDNEKSLWILGGMRFKSLWQVLRHTNVCT